MGSWLAGRSREQGEEREGGEQGEEAEEAHRVEGKLRAQLARQRHSRKHPSLLREEEEDLAQGRLGVRVLLVGLGGAW